MDNLIDSIESSELKILFIYLDLSNNFRWQNDINYTRYQEKVLFHKELGIWVPENQRWSKRSQNN